MTNYCTGLLHGMVFETTVESFTGPYLYSDFATGYRGEKDTALNSIVKIPFVGILGGITRMALGIVHTLGHLLAALFTFNKGHLFHAAKGICETFRGAIETIPIVGRIFANLYNSAPVWDPDFEGARCWWMIKIYNPTKPDGLDAHMDHWVNFPQCYYVKA